MEQQYIIGVDIGTTSTKAVLFTLNGKAVETAYSYYSLIKEMPEKAEQEVEVIYQAVLQTIKQVSSDERIKPEQILCVSFSSAMHSMILLDEQGQPLTRSITWADNRASHYAEELKNNGGENIYYHTGTPIHPMSPLCKLIWFREEQPEIFAKVHKIIGIKEYIFYRLFDTYLVDYSVASSTGLFNIRTFEWDKEAMDCAGISVNQLSKAVSPTAQVSGLSPETAKELGLLPQTPFVVGGNDGCLSNLGVGAVDQGETAVTIGTSGAVRMVSEQPYTDNEGRVFCYILDESHWVIGGAVNNGGVVLDWAREKFTPEDITDNYLTIMERIATVPAGSNELFFHPYLNGERAPLWDANARGSFFGIQMMHNSNHFLRAVLEGICYNLYDVLLEIESTVGAPRKITATGGFSQSPVWRQMLADVFQQEIAVPESFESSCLGAAVLGMKSIRQISDIHAVKKMTGLYYSHKPDPKSSAVYHAAFPLYRKLSRQFVHYYKELSELSSH
ncbi:MAG: gluconokinase [Pisciglobus halotolerans]|nr:gluconokinase [Pisciglobus halotolerans]